MRVNKHRRWPWMLVSAMAGAGLVVSGAALARESAPEKGATRGEAGAERSPQQILERMSKTIGSARALTVNAERVADPALTLPGKGDERTRIQVRVLRPNLLRARAVGKDVTREIVADGKRVWVLDATKNLYATAPTGGTIDQTTVQLSERFGFPLPLGEFVANDPLALISTHARSATYRGRQEINGERCDHLTLKGDQADADLWVSTETSLPCKLVAVFREPGNPSLSITFSDWNLNADLSPRDFEFKPPKGAQEIPMVPRERTEAEAD